MNLLLSISDNFTQPLLTTLLSIRINTPEHPIAVYVLQKEKLSTTEQIDQFCQSHNMTYHPIIVGDTFFSQAPTSVRWPESIYYRLLAHEFLPKSLDRILYLDADILCINSIRSLYETDIADNLYGAASHSLLELTDTINRYRLGNKDLTSYYNSGVLLMNLNAIRERVNREAIFQYIQANHTTLLLPDQDILNGLYGGHIFPLADELYNFDSRLLRLYTLKSQFKVDIDWVIDNTVFIHFCGKDKPWTATTHNKFSVLYKHYQRLLAQYDHQAMD